MAATRWIVNAVWAGVVAVALVVGVAGAAEIGDDWETPRHCLWRVRSETNTIYLVGSIHIMRSDAYPLAAVIETAFASSEAAVFEVDLSAAGGAETALGAVAATMLSGGRTLRDVVSPQTYELTRQRLEAAGLSVAATERMRPWMVASTLALAELRRAGYSPADGVDQYFQRRAASAGKRVEGLESVRDQLELFADLTPEEDEAFLVQTLRELESVIPMVDELIGHWQAGRVAEVESFLAEGYEDFPELFDRLVADRNRIWLARIEGLLAGSERAFVVVGALHLVGDEGLVALLRAKGYQVEQL